MVLVVKNPPANAGDIGDVGSVPVLGRFPGGGHGNPLQYSYLENPMDRGAWRATVHGVTKSLTGLMWLRTHTHKRCIRKWYCVLKVIWPPDVKNRLIGKETAADKDWGQEEKGAIEGEMVGWHHQLNGHESEQTPGDSEGQESLACCCPWGCKESDTT